LPKQLPPTLVSTFFSVAETPLSATLHSFTLHHRRNNSIQHLFHLFLLLKHHLPATFHHSFTMLKHHRSALFEFSSDTETPVINSSSSTAIASILL
jgi:hypothetical protein